MTNIRHKAVNITKKSNLIKEKKSFLGWQLQVPVDKNIVCMHA
jgi:hypothetical protein